MRTHTIGEVLNHLKDEFSDITISKIRFLEAEGLISPDRTESGYRKFTPADVERLRYVLRAQRDRYLPLKVIKEELARIDAGLPVEATGTAPASGEVAAVRGLPEEGEPTGSAPGEVVLDHPPTDLHLSRAEVADATGLSETDVEELRSHGLIGPGPGHDGDDLRIAKLAADLLAFGLEARHLRMYRQFAEREATLIEQLIGPLLRQRNPDSRRTATEQAERLVDRGGELHRWLLARELRTLIRS